MEGGIGRDGNVDAVLDPDAAPPVGDSGEKGEMGDKAGSGGRDIIGGGREGGTLLLCVGEYEIDEEGEDSIDPFENVVDAVVARRAMGVWLVSSIEVFRVERIGCASVTLCSVGSVSSCLL